MSAHLVVIGGGQAAAQTIQSARQLGYDGRITLIADENALPYQRPPLSKQYLAGNFPRERLELRPASFYEARDVDVLLGRSATHIDLAHNRVGLDDGGRLEFTSLLLATGGRPRRLDVPGADLTGVHCLRSIGDVDAIAPGMTAGRRVVIVGGGYIGLEVAAVAVTMGLDVTVLEAADRVLARVVAPEMSAFYTARHRRSGVRIECNAAVSALRGSGAVEWVETGDGTRYPADLVIVGIGILPNTEIAVAAGLDGAAGVRVDPCARTAADGILAAGDCTRHVHPCVGAEARIESVHNAIGQAKAAAATLVGRRDPFDDVPWFWSDQYDLKLQIAGLALHYDSTVLRGEPESGSFALFYLRDGVPVAADCVNSPRVFMTAKKLVTAAAAVPPAALADPDTDLGDYL